MAACLLLPLAPGATLPDGTTEYPPHVTLLYLGDMTEAEQLRAKTALLPLSRTFPNTFFRVASDYATFGDPETDERSLVIRLTEPGAGKLKLLRDEAMSLLRKAGVQFPQPSFPEFLPHVTIDEGTSYEMLKRSTTEKPNIRTVELTAPVISVEGRYLTAAAPMLPVEAYAYSEDQPRDSSGRFGSGDGEGKSESKSEERKPLDINAADVKLKGTSDPNVKEMVHPEHGKIGEVKSNSVGVTMPGTKYTSGSTRSWQATLDKDFIKANTGPTTWAKVESNPQLLRGGSANSAQGASRNGVLAAEMLSNKKEPVTASAEDQPRDDNGRFGSGGGGSTHEVETTKLTATVAKALSKELDEQGAPKDAPIRHVLGSEGAWRGEQVAVSRDANGKITGGAAYSRVGKNEISLLDFRAVEKGGGAGTALMSKIASEIADQKNPSMTVHGAVHTATSYYQKIGAEFTPKLTSGAADATYEWSSTGMWDGDAVRALAAGDPIDRRGEQVLPDRSKGEIWDGARIVSATASADLMRYRVRTFAYNEDQPRDDNGRFGSGGGGGSEEAAPKPTYEEVRSWPQVSGPLGSQGGTWHQAPDGKTYLMKPTTTVNRASNEIAAGLIYKAAGLPFPNVQMITNEAGKPFILSEKMEGLEQRSHGWWESHPDAQAKAAEGYGVDALISHWDVLGLEADNTLTTADGTPVRIESGGAMGYRAMGGPKDSFAEGKQWGEPKSMRTSEGGRTLYGKMTNEQAADSLERAANIDLQKVANAWKEAGISEKDSAPWMRTLQERQDKIPAIVGRLRGNTELAIRLRTMVFEACHMPAGTPDGGQFVPCDTPGSVDSDGNPAGPDSAADIAQSAQKAAEAAGSSKAEAKAIGEAAKQQAEAEGVKAPPSPYEAAGKPEAAPKEEGATKEAAPKPEGDTKNVGAGKLEEHSIKGLKGTPQYSTITHALYNLKHTEKGAAGKEQAQQVGDKSIYPFIGKKYEYMVVAETGDPKQPNVYEFIPKGGTSMLLDHQTVEDAVAGKESALDIAPEKQAIYDQMNEEAAAQEAAGYDVSGGHADEAAFLASLVTTPEQAAFLAEANADAVSPEDIAANTLSLAPEAFNEGASLYATEKTVYEPGPQEMQVAQLLTQPTSNGDPDYMKIQDALASGAAPTLIDDLLDSVAINALTYEEAAGVLTGDYNPTQEQWEKMAADQSDSAIQYIAGQVLGQINSTDWFDKTDEMLTELHGDGIHGAEATMAMLSDMFEAQGKSFGGTEDAAGAIAAAVDISSQSFEPGGKFEEFSNLTAATVGPSGVVMPQDAYEALLKMGYGAGFASDLTQVGTVVGHEKMFEAITNHDMQSFTENDLQHMNNMLTLGEINTFIDAAEMHGGVSGAVGTDERLAQLKDVQAQNAPGGATQGLTAPYYSSLDMKGKMDALIAGGLSKVAANELVAGGVGAPMAMAIVDLHSVGGGINDLDHQWVSPLADLPAGSIAAVLNELGVTDAQWDKALSDKIDMGFDYDTAKFEAVQELQSNGAAGFVDVGAMTVQEHWQQFKEDQNYNIGTNEINAFWSAQGFFTTTDKEGLTKMSNSIGMDKVLDILENKSLEGLSQEDITKLASNMSLSDYAPLDKALGMQGDLMNAGNPISALQEKFLDDTGAAHDLSTPDALDEETGPTVPDLNDWEQMDNAQQYAVLLDNGATSDVATIISETSYLKTQPEMALAIMEAQGDISKMTAQEVANLATYLHPNDLPYVMAYMGVPVSDWNDMQNVKQMENPNASWQEQALFTANALYSAFETPAPPMPLSEKLDSIANPYDKLTAFKDAYPQLPGDTAAKLISGLEDGHITSQQLQDLMSGAKAPGELPLNTLLSNMYASDIAALSEHLGAKPGAYDKLANEMYLKDPNNPNYTKLGVLDAVMKQANAPAGGVSSSPNAVLANEIQEAVKGFQGTAADMISNNFPGVVGTSFASIAEYAMSQGNVTGLDITNFLSGKVGIEKIPGLQDVIMAMSPEGLDKLAVGLGAEPGAFISQYDPKGIDSGSKIDVLSNVVAVEAPVSHETAAETFAGLAYGDKEAFALQNGVTGDKQIDALFNMFGGKTDLNGVFVDGIDQQKAFEVFTDKSLSHLSADDITSIAHSLDGPQILELGTNVLGLPASVVTGLAQEAVKDLGKPATSANKDEHAEYVLNKLQALADGSVPGTMGAVPGSSVDSISDKFSQAGNGMGSAQIKANILESTGLISNTGYQTTANVLNAIDHPTYGLGIDKVMAMLQNPDHAAALLTNNEMAAFANLPDTIISSVVPGFYEANQPNLGFSTDTLNQMQQAQGGHITPDQLANADVKGLADVKMSEGMIPTQFSQIMNTTSAQQFLEDHGVKPWLASNIVLMGQSGASANDLMTALDTHSIAHIDENTLINIATVMGTVSLSETLQDLTGGSKQHFEELFDMAKLAGGSQYEQQLEVLKQTQKDFPAAEPKVEGLSKGLATENMQQNALKFAAYGGSQEGEEYLKSLGINANLATGISYLHGEGMDENTLMKMLDNQSLAHMTEAEAGVLMSALGNSGTDNLVNEITGAPKGTFETKLAEVSSDHGSQTQFATPQMKYEALQQINAQYGPKSPPYGVQPTNYAVDAQKLDSITLEQDKSTFLKELMDASGTGSDWTAADNLVNATLQGMSSEMAVQIASNQTMTGASSADIKALTQQGTLALNEMLTGYGMSVTDLMTNAPPIPSALQTSMGSVEWQKLWALSELAQQSVSPTNPQMSDVQAKIAEIQAADKSLSYKDAKDQAEALLLTPQEPPVGLNASGGKIYGDPSVKVQASDLTGAAKVFNTSPVSGGIKPSLPNNAQIDNIIAKATMEYHSGTGISTYQYGNQVISLKQNADGTYGARYYPNGVLDPKTGKIDVPEPKVAVNAPGISQASLAVLEGTQLGSYTDYKNAKAEYDQKQKAAQDKTATKYPLPDIVGKGAGEMPVAAKHTGYTALGAGTTPGYVATSHDANGKVSGGYYVYGKSDKIAINRFEKLRDTIAHADGVKHGVGAPQGVHLPYNLSADRIESFSQYQFKDGVFTLYKTDEGKLGVNFEKGAKLEGAFEKIQQKAYSSSAGKVPVPAGGVFYGHEPQGNAKDFGSDKQASIHWGDEKYGPNGGPKNYTATEFSALKAYGDSSYDNINSAMRGSYGYGSNSHALDQARLIDQGMRRTPTPEPITVYRGLKAHSQHAKDIANSPVGSLFRDKGFMSTSVSTGTAQTFAGGVGSGGYILKIDVPEGVPSSFKPGNQYPTEAELLIASNTTLEKTGEAYKDSNGFWVVPVRVVAVGAEPVDIGAAIQAGGGVVPAMIGSLLLEMQAARMRRILVAA